MPRLVKSTPYQDELDEIKSDFKELKDDVFALGEHIKSDSKNASEKIADTAQTRLKKMKEYGRLKYDQAEGQVKKKPIESVAAAFGAGLLISTLLSR